MKTARLSAPLLSQSLLLIPESDCSTLKVIASEVLCPTVVGNSVGANEGANEGVAVGTGVGANEGVAVGTGVGANEGVAVGTGVGDLDKSSTVAKE